VKKDPQIQESNQDDFALLGSFDARYAFYQLENLEEIMNSAPSELIQSSLNNKKIEFERKREEKVEGILLRSLLEYML
jgi:SHS2 domain-containing protein